MNPILAACWIASSLLLLGCQTSDRLDEETICSLRPISISPAVREHLRRPLAAGQPLPAGYDRFLRDLVAHNAKMAQHCPSSR
jgi:hypothetical protein